MKQQRPSRATIRAVAERAGVSIATVSRVVNGLHDKTGDATIRRVLDAVAVLGYRTQSAGRTLRQRESRIVGVLVANLANPAMAAIAASIEAALRDAGYVMALCDTHEKPDIQDEYLAEMEAQAACGIVMVVAVPSPKLDALRAAGQPLVFVNRRDPAGDASAFVGIDDFAAGRELARYVAARTDLRPVGLVHASLAFSAGALRAAGFQHGMAEFGVADVPYASYASANHLEIGYHGLGDLLARREPPRFVVCLSDLLAYGAYRRACEARLRVGEDIIFASFDDNPLNDWIAPWLSAIRIPFAAFGPAVVATLGELLAGEAAKIRLLAHHLELRDGGMAETPAATGPIARE
jgi:LacI family transcriptional regulator